jgi:hypothetical protein
MTDKRERPDHAAGNLPLLSATYLCFPITTGDSPLSNKNP